MLPGRVEADYIVSANATAGGASDSDSNSIGLAFAVAEGSLSRASANASVFDPGSPIPGPPASLNWYGLGAYVEVSTEDTESLPLGSASADARSVVTDRLLPVGNLDQTSVIFTLHLSGHIDATFGHPGGNSGGVAEITAQLIIPYRSEDGSLHDAIATDHRGFEIRADGSFDEGNVPTEGTVSEDFVFRGPSLPPGAAMLFPWEFTIELSAGAVISPNMFVKVDFEDTVSLTSIEFRDPQDNIVSGIRMFGELGEYPVVQSAAPVPEPSSGVMCGWVAVATLAYLFRRATRKGQSR